jgi:glycosyltransferase involved in cell wall biosynthesis
MKDILFITYYFPPIGGAGVQRSLKFAKYLPDFGINPIVLTQHAKNSDKWAPIDESLGKDVDQHSLIFRALPAPAISKGEKALNKLRWYCGIKTSYLDHWCNEVLRLAETARSQRPYRAILATMSPFENCLPASILADRFKIPWIADLRDPWALDEFQIYPSWIHRKFEKRRMESSLRSASLIIMNTPTSAALVREQFPKLSHIPVISLTNGYDAEDFEGAPPTPDSKTFTIVHAGHLHTQAGNHQRRNEFLYNALKRSEPGVRLLSRSHYFLLKALERWRLENPEIGKTVRFAQVGSTTSDDRDLISRSTVADMVELTGYASHVDSLIRIRSADLLFLPLHTVKEGARSTIVPGKVYEYLATGIPILAALPAGDAKDFVLESGMGRVCAPDDVDGILEILKREYDRWMQNQPAPIKNETYVRGFERRNLTAQLADALERLMN